MALPEVPEHRCGSPSPLTCLPLSCWAGRVEVRGPGGILRHMESSSGTLSPTIGVSQRALKERGPSPRHGSQMAELQAEGRQVGVHGLQGPVGVWVGDGRMFQAYGCPAL